jgi:hypothetical protein
VDNVLRLLQEISQNMLLNALIISSGNVFERHTLLTSCTLLSEYIARGTEEGLGNTSVGLMTWVPRLKSKSPLLC